MELVRSSLSIHCGLPCETVRSAPLQLFFQGLLSVYSRYGLHARRVATWFSLGVGCRLLETRRTRLERHLSFPVADLLQVQGHRWMRPSRALMTSALAMMSQPDHCCHPPPSAR